MMMALKAWAIFLFCLFFNLFKVWWAPPLSFLVCEATGDPFSDAPLLEILNKHEKNSGSLISHKNKFESKNSLRDFPERIKSAINFRESVTFDNPHPLSIKGGALFRRRVRIRRRTESGLAASAFNLVNNVAGAGILALPAGMAVGTGWVPALTICVAIGIMSGYTFQLVGHSCYIGDEYDFKSLWSKVFGRKTAWQVEAGIATLCFFCAVIYAGILGDAFTPLFDAAGLPPSLNQRHTNIVLISATILLPLSLLENLSALAFTSFLGVVSVIYTAFFIILRSVDGTYAPGSVFYETLSENLQPAFEKQSLWGFTPKALVLVSNLGLAFIAHYNAPRFWTELRGRSPRRFGLLVTMSFLVLTLLYSSVMAAGYKTFGDNCQSNIIKNYHPDDVLAGLARLATGISILFGFPLTFIGLRDGFIGSCKSLLELRELENWSPFRRFRKADLPRTIFTDLKEYAVKYKNMKKVSIALLIVVTVMAALVKDIGLIVGISGSICGASIVYVVPSLIYYYIMKEDAPKQMSKYTKLNLIFAPFGVFLAVLGVGITIQEYFFTN
mmetsp:Transcript_14676/g.18755  ORF Transcript_14676/g.18755 Transcript_14676/m.18755 type:complete len:556 (-) Transcript_14676:373-2040(-)